MRFPLRLRRAGAVAWLWCIFGFYVAGCVGSLAGEETQPHAAQVRALVEKRFDPAGPGVAILVSRDGAPVYLGGFGLADVGSGRKITPDSLFDLASVSKHMTAVAILTLQEAGKLRLDEPIAKLLPDYRVPTKGRPVTVNDLLHHVAGLRDYTDEDDWTGTDAEFAALTPETHLAWLNGTVPRRAPGVKYEYNNTEYALLSLIVERLSGGSFLHYVRATLFAPAGMSHTTILDGSADLPASRVKGYAATGRGKAKPSFQPTVMTGDGNVYTSVRDLAAWDAALRAHTIISQESQETAWTGGKYDNGKPVRDEDGDGYAAGWFVDKSRPLVYHSGSWDGTSTYLLMEPRRGYTVAVLSNDENAESGQLAESLLALFHDDLASPRDAAKPTPGKKEVEPPAKKSPFMD